jgi:raffinose/stachyose/melibiose transport system substrate-binding protein
MRKSMKKAVAVVSVVTMCTALVVGCGGKKSEDSSSSGGSEETKKIVFWNGGTEKVDKGVYDTLVKEFNSTTKTGYEVESVSIQNDTYKEKLVIAMSSGECPDMYTHWSGGPMNEYINAGYAQPITDMYTETGMKDRIMEAGTAQATYEDEVYAVPFFNVALSGIYYNTELFEKYNLEVPTTVSELEKVCDTFLANGITPFALANATKWTGSMYFMNLAARKGGLEPFNEAVAGTGSFEDECFIYAGEKIQEWVEKGYFPEGVNSLSEDDGQARQLLYKETAAMDLIGSWYTGVVKAENEEFFNKMGWFSFPAVDGSSADPSIVIGTIGDNFISFNCDGDKLTAAVECASLFSQDKMVDYMTSVGKIPPIQGVEDKLEDEISMQVITAALDAPATQLWYDQYLPPSVAQAHLDTCQELFGLTMTPQEAAKQFQAAMQEYIADNK